MKRTLIFTLISLCVFSSHAQTDTSAVADTTISTIVTMETVGDTVATPLAFTEPMNSGSDEIYSIRGWRDIPWTLATTAYTLWGFSNIYSREKTPEARILALDPNDVNSLDRPTTKNHDLKAKDASDMLFYGSMPLPLIFVFDKEIRKDALKVGLMYLQTMSTFGVVYTSSAMLADRFRPYTYNPEVPLGKRTGGGGKNSFMAGHPGLVASSTFFVAKVFNDYHPEWRNKWILFSLAGAASVTTGILRIKAGEHFPTDVMVGIPMGVLSGILIPHMHKNKDLSKQRLTLLPVMGNGSYGFHATYKLR